MVETPPPQLGGFELPVLPSALDVNEPGEEPLALAVEPAPLAMAMAPVFPLAAAGPSTQHTVTGVGLGDLAPRSGDTRDEGDGSKSSGDDSDSDDSDDDSDDNDDSDDSDDSDESDESDDDNSSDAADAAPSRNESDHTYDSDTVSDAASRSGGTPQLGQQGVDHTGIPIPAHAAPGHGEFTDADPTAIADGTAVPEPPRFEHGTGSARRAGHTGTNQNDGMNMAGSDFGAVADAAADDVSDWRAAVLKGDFNADLTGRLLKQAFASEIEKHLAIQCVALVAGNCDRLSNWHWRVWRQADEYGYPLSGKDRYNAGSTPAALHSSLHKFVIAAAPLMVRVKRERFSLAYLARGLEVTVPAIEKLRQALDWRKGLLNDVGLRWYADQFVANRFLVYNLPGLAGELFYDGTKRAIYLDEAYYRRVPPSHLFHRMLGLLWSVRIHSFVPLQLDPLKHFMPLLAEIHQTLGANGINAIKSRLKGGQTLVRHLAGADMRQLRSLYEKIGMPTEEQVLQLWEAMRGHIYRLLLAETLDVVGLFESILNKDLLQKDILKHSAVFQASPYARPLIEFATKLKI